MRLCVIPARGGSKRIPRKNIREFCGKPIIAWSIEIAIQSGCFDKIIVSTEDSEIASIAQLYGAETPFKRPAKLSDDYTTTTEVVSHAVHWYFDNGVNLTAVCCVYPTAVLMQAEDLREGLKLLLNNNLGYVLSVTSFPFPIQRALRITSEGRTEMFNPKNQNIRSQDLEEAWHDAGQFYWGNSESWLKKKPIFSTNSMPIIIPSYRVQDIDTPDDWDRAKLLFEVLKYNNRI